MNPPRSRDSVNEVRRALSDPRRVCHALGLAKGSQRQASGLLIVCPWHADKGPSCSVTRGPDGTVRVKCLACGASGDVLSLVAKVHALDVKRQFREVLTAAADLAGRYDLVAETSIDRELAPPQIPDEAFDTIVRELLRCCPLRPHSKGSAYLANRGLLDQALEDGWGELPPYPRQAPLVAHLRQRFGDENLLGAALIWKGPGGVDPRALRRPSHLLLMPWKNAACVIVALQRRLLDPPKHDDTPKYVFTTGRSPRAPYGVASVRPGRDLAVVEGAMDQLAIRALLRGLAVDRDAIGIAGVQAWRTEYAAIGAGRRVLVALDADKAGEASVQKLTNDFSRAGARVVQRWRPPEGLKDWGELAAQRARCA